MAIPRPRTSALIAMLSLTGAGCVASVGDGAGGEREAAGESFPTIRVEGGPSDRPAAQHPDLNIKLRGLAPSEAPMQGVHYDGPDDRGAPQLSTVLSGDETMVAGHKVGRFGGLGQGTEGTYPVHVLELATRSGEAVSLPSSAYRIGDGAEAMVLYADADSLTIKYTREDSVVTGYTVHLLGLRVDGALLETYRDCDAQGRGELPALRPGAVVGSAGDRLRIAVRDTGRFMDPRADDWWRDGAPRSQQAAPAPATAAPPSPSPAPPDQPAPAPAQPDQPAPAPRPGPSSGGCAPGDSSCCPAEAACCDGGVQLLLSGAPQACGGVTITVRTAQAHSWVIAGIEGASGTIAWRGGASVLSCGGGACSWAFSGMSVPCEGGPYRLHFMVDAVQDNPEVGHHLAACTP